MTHRELIESLSQELSVALKDVVLRTEYAKTPAAENFMPVTVFTQYLPKDLFEETAYFPCVLVEWLSTEDDLKTGSVTTIGLTCGTYSLEQNAYRDALHLMEICRMHLLTRRIVAKKFALNSLSWSTPDPQPEPFFFVIGTATYSTFLPQQVGLPI